MNTKLTLSLDKEVIERAKDYARAHHMSISALVENLLSKITSEEAPMKEQSGSIVKELSGILQLEGPDYKALHAKYLEEKYQ